MGNPVDYWYEEGSHAFKAGIPMRELLHHYPESKMEPAEWDALECGWVTEQRKLLEESGQARLF